MADCRVAADVGGTFTDIYLLDTDGGGGAGVRSAVAKVPTTADPMGGVLDGLRSVGVDPSAAVVERYRQGEIDQLDLIRHHGVILNWDTGELLPNTTAQFRAMLRRRSASHWGLAHGRARVVALPPPG
jgi:hypothetical protein